MADEKVIPINELSIQRIGKLLPQWLQWGVAHNCQLEVVVRKREESRTTDQNSRMWKMLSVLEEHGVPCPGNHDNPTSKEGWHEHLRLKYGYIHGTRTIGLPDGAGGFFLVETPNPQPTHKGAKGQMTKAQHSEYMERIEDELYNAGLYEQWASVECV